MLQQKKRLSAASIVGCSSHQPSRAKRKSLGSTQCGLNMRSHISLNWDDNKKRVVAKREQIAISWRDLSPFINSVPHCPNILADIWAIPPEIFELKGLTEVLSFEVWQTHLSEKERDLLTQFLPSGLDGQQVVQALLAGDNFHFGNPFLKWGASLCSGDLHPDAVLSKEQCLKTNKKAYYLELQKYHNDNIANLQKWKERWAICKDPEKEIVQNIWRSKKHADESGFHDSEENLAATSESCSWAADEKACSSDNQNSSRKDGELQKGKDLMKDKCKSPVAASNGLKVVTRTRKRVKFSKLNIHYGDGAKYMSYIKISKKQHQLVKSMKQSGNSIQPRSLNRVLGDLDSFHIRPYEVFEEEEKRKLHEHWSQLATRDLPAAFANRGKKQLQRRQMTQSLALEMEERLKPLVEDDEKEGPDSILQEQEDNGATDHEPTMDDDDKPVPDSNQNQTIQPIPLLNDNLEFGPMDMDPENNHVVSKLDDDSPSEKSEGLGNLSPEDVAVSQGLPLSSGCDVRSAFSMPDAYYGSTSLNHEYTSTRESSLGHSHIIEQPSCLIDLESEMHKEGSGKDLLHRESNHGPFFSPYPNPDRSGLLQSFMKGQGMLPYHHEQEQTVLDFHPTTNVLIETGQFPGHLQEQLQLTLPLEQRQKRQDEIYMHQNMQENMYSDVGRYSIPRQEHFSTVNMQDWSVNPARVSTPLQPHLNGGDLLSQNWLPGEHRPRGGWSGSDGVGVGVGVLSHSIGNRGNTDGSLFSVLSHCREFQSGGPYESMGSTEHFISSRNYGGLGGGIPRSTTVLPQAANPLNFLSGCEAAATPKTNNMGWTSLPHQNSALNDSMGEPFLRSWNQ